MPPSRNFDMNFLSRTSGVTLDVNVGSKKLLITNKAGECSHPISHTGISQFFLRAYQHLHQPILYKAQNHA